MVAPLITRLSGAGVVAHRLAGAGWTARRAAAGYSPRSTSAAFAATMAPARCLHTKGPPISAGCG